MGVPQNPIVVLSFLGAAAAAVGALRRWRRGRGQRLQREKAAKQTDLVDQTGQVGNVAKSQVWTTGQGDRLTAVKGEWDNESSLKVVVDNAVVKDDEKGNASPQKGVSDDGVGQAWGGVNVRAQKGGASLAKSDEGQGQAAVISEAHILPPTPRKKKKIIRRRKVSKAGSPKPGASNVDATRAESVPVKGPSEKVGIEAEGTDKSGKMQQEARGGVLVNHSLDKLKSEAPADEKTRANVNKARAELQVAPSEGDTKPEGAAMDKMGGNTEGESAKVPPSAEVPDKKRTPSPFMGMKRGFLSSGRKTAPKLQNNEAAPVAREPDEEKGTQASRGVEEPVQETMRAALDAKNAPLAEVSPQSLPQESYITPRKERYVDTEAEKDREESPERTPTSVLNAFPDSPESDNGGLSFAGPTRGGSGNVWKRGPIFADRPSGSPEGGLLPLPERSSKGGGNRERHAVQSEGEGSEDKGEAPERLKGGRMESQMEGAEWKESEGGWVGDEKKLSAKKSTERQLSLQPWLNAPGGVSSKAGSKGFLNEQPDGSKAAAPKRGGSEHGEAQQMVRKSVDEEGGAVKGSQKPPSEEGMDERETASQEVGQQDIPREGEQLRAERRQSGSASDSAACANGSASQQIPEAPSSQSTDDHSSIELGSNKASGLQTLPSAVNPPPSDLQGSTTSQIGSDHGEESLVGFKPASENHRSPQASPAPTSPLPNGSNLAKPESTDGSSSVTRDLPSRRNEAPGAFKVNRLVWANPEQDLDGFDSATDSFATPAASAPASPRVSQPGFANPKKEASAGHPASKCEIEEVANGPEDTGANLQRNTGLANGFSGGEMNGVRGEELEVEKNSAAIAAVAVAACAWCGHALAGVDDEELSLCCMLALQKLQSEVKANESGAKGAATTGTAVASSRDVNGGLTLADAADRKKVKESGDAVKEGGQFGRQENGLGGAGKSEKTGADAKAARRRKVEAAALRASEGTRWAAKVRAWLEGTSYSDAAR